MRRSATATAAIATAAGASIETTVNARWRLRVARHKPTRTHNPLIHRWFGTSAVGVEWMRPTRPAGRPTRRLALRALHEKRWQSRSPLSFAGRVRALIAHVMRCGKRIFASFPTTAHGYAISRDRVSTSARLLDVILRSHRRHPATVPLGDLTNNSPRLSSAASGSTSMGSSSVTR